MNQKFKNFLKLNILTILTLLSVVVGIIIGFIIRSTSLEKWSQRDVMYLSFIGDLFLRALRALILPLIISSLISAVGSLDLGLSKKIGFRAICYYLTTTVMAVILGIILVIVIQPGVGAYHHSMDSSESMSRNITTVDTLMDLIRNMIPPNIVQACIEQFHTILVPPTVEPFEYDLTKWNISEGYARGTNILGLVVVSIIFGIALSIMGDETKMLLKLCNEFSSAVMKITKWIIWLSPIGILFLVSAKIVEMDDLETIMGKLGLYFLTVLGGILFHGFIILPLIYFIGTRKNPYKFIGNMGQAIVTAFGTSSSSATLPVTMQCLEEKNNIDARVSRFVLPIGATINMDGTALYEAVAAIFIAQIRGITLSFGNIVAISITATAASIGAAGIPQAGLVTMVMVLDTVGLPASDVSLIIAVDWLLDRFRTTINVIGDFLGAGLVEHLSRKELQENKMIVTESQTLSTVDNFPNGTVSVSPYYNNEETKNEVNYRDLSSRL